MLVIFDTANIYYLPQFQPIIKVLLASGHEVKLACYSSNIGSSFKSVIAKMAGECCWVADEKEAAKLSASAQPENLMC